MKRIVGVIPARYQSSRFPGKSLADLCGRSMIWWVCQEAKKVEVFERVIVATESQLIVDDKGVPGRKSRTTSLSEVAA